MFERARSRSRKPPARILQFNCGGEAAPERLPMARLSRRLPQDADIVA